MVNHSVHSTTHFALWAITEERPLESNSRGIRETTVWRGMGPKRGDYLHLFGEFGAALSDAEWIARANDSLPPNLSALNARFVTGSRADRFLQVSYHPGPEYFTFMSLSGGSVAEMLDQAAAHCGTFITSHGCPTLTLTTNYLRPGIGSFFVATARVLTVTSVSAVLGADLADEEEGRSLQRPSSCS